MDIIDISELEYTKFSRYLQMTERWTYEELKATTVYMEKFPQFSMGIPRPYASLY